MDKSEQKILRIIEDFGKKLPHFPDGRIDYSHSNKAPVLNCFVRHGNQILIVKRSEKVRVYKNKWDTVCGYLDEVKPLQEKVLEEIQEELGIHQNYISSIHIGKYFKFNDIDENKIWLVCPVLVELKTSPEIKLDWEHTEYKWIKPEDLAKFDTVPGHEESFKRASM